MTVLRDSSLKMVVKKPPLQRRRFINMAGPTRLELATSGVTGLRSNQLNYDPAYERPELGGGGGFEPTTPCV